MQPIATFRTKRGRLALICDNPVPWSKADIEMRLPPEEDGGGPMVIRFYYMNDLENSQFPSLRRFHKCGTDCTRSDDGRRPFGHWMRHPAR